jgi:hypothetical protein
MEESGEQCTVVFVLTVMEQAIECVCVEAPPPPSRFRNNLGKDDSALFSRVRIFKRLWSPGIGMITLFLLGS